MLMFRFTATLLLFSSLCLAKEATPTPTPAPTATPVVKSETRLFRLEGGGEVIGTLLKESSGQYFVDLGPTVLTLERRSVSEVLTMEEMEALQSKVEQSGAGTLDPATGVFISRPRESTQAARTQQEMLETVKRSVVLVSNPRGLGTGWVVDSEGGIITNQHVVGSELFQTVTIFVKSGAQWEKKRIDNCKVEALTDLYDIALVRLNMDEVRKQGIVLEPLAVARTASLEAGDSVYAVGNPGMGGMVLDHTISEGIVSSLARNFNDVVYLQTTAAVNPGNSGGPLINDRGEVVGLVTLKAIFQEGVAFALPVDQLRFFLTNSRAFAVQEAARSGAFRYHRPQ